jgi:hypothetical protein
MSAEQLARQMYEQQDNRVVPPWDSLTGGTRALWLERAQVQLDAHGDLA